MNANVEINYNGMAYYEKNRHSKTSQRERERMESLIVFPYKQVVEQERERERERY
jgi:hypothetical protein